LPPVLNTRDSGCQCEQKLDRGDMILRVDGIEASNANVSALLVGNDIPGSTAIVTVQKVREFFSSLGHAFHLHGYRRSERTACIYRMRTLFVWPSSQK
jgi:hypothetical protein